MNIELRPYQNHDQQRIWETINLGQRRVLYVLPTGGGKTVVASMLSQLINSKNESILFLTHRRELIKQAYTTIKESLPRVEIGLIAPNTEYTENASVQIASVQTLVNRRIKPPQWIFVDEAHPRESQDMGLLAHSMGPSISHWPNRHSITFGWERFT